MPKHVQPALQGQCVDCRWDILHLQRGVTGRTGTCSSGSRSFMSKKRLGTFDAYVLCARSAIPSKIMCLCRLCIDSGCMVTTSFSLPMLHAKALDEGPVRPWSANGDVPHVSPG